MPTEGPVQGLQHELGLADQEMQAAGSSASLPQAQQHAQAVVNILGGAAGRWAGDTPYGDGSDRRGVLPGDRVPGPANGTSTDLTPFGWAVRAYDLGDSQTQQTVAGLIGDVNQWRTNPRGSYDVIESALTAPGAGHKRLASLDGTAVQALAWARLIVTSATTLDEARQFATAGGQQTSLALAAAQSLR